MPVSWQMGPESSTAISMLDKIMSNAWEDCVSGVSSFAAMDIAARTSGGRLVDVWVISSSKLPARNSISLPPQTNYFTLLRGGGPETLFRLQRFDLIEVSSTQFPVSGLLRWDEKAGLRRDAICSQRL